MSNKVVVMTALSMICGILRFIVLGFGLSQIFMHTDHPVYYYILLAILILAFHRLNRLLFAVGAAMHNKNKQDGEANGKG